MNPEESIIKDLKASVEYSKTKLPEYLRSQYDEMALLWTQNLISLFTSLKDGTLTVEEVVLPLAEYISLLDIEGAIDPLTQIWDRKGIEKVSEVLINHSFRSQERLIGAILDVDKFKVINTKYGHFVGDEVLEKFVSLTQNSLRKQDLLGRWGGEEFIILLPNTNSSGAGNKLEN